MNSSENDPPGHGVSATTWKAVALLLAGGAGGGVVQKVTAITRADVAQMIEQGPYTRDRGSIEVRLRAVEHNTAQVSADVAQITKGITKLETKIDVLLQR